MSRESITCYTTHSPAHKLRDTYLRTLKSCVIRWFAVLIVVLLLLPSGAYADAITSFSFTSSSESWIGQGKSRYIIPEDGWNFNTSKNSYNGVDVLISNTDHNAPPSNSFWILYFSAPYARYLAPGHYPDAVRYSFQLLSQPGLDIAGNHRGVGKLTGFFDVLEVENDGGFATRFAADFTVYENGDPNRWIHGQIRYNALVPEPASCFGLVILGGVWMNSRACGRASDVNPDNC